MRLMVSLPKTLKSFMATAAALTTLALSVQAAAQTTGGLRLPPNYLSRFSSTELAATNDSGYGVRYFPLPIEPDLRLSILKAKDYWEYNISTRQKDTTFAFGVFNNGYTAAAGIPKFEITHDPYKGVQYSGVVQHLFGILPVKSYDPYSKFTVGYAFAVWNDRIRILNNVGVGYKTITDDAAPYAINKEIVAPFTQTEAAGGYSKPVTDKINVGIYTTARLFTFPMQGQYQASIDLSPSINVQVTPQFSVSASQLERFAVGSVPISDLNYARYQESYATLTYRLPKDSPVGMLRSRLTKNWVGDSGNTYLRNDVLFNVPQIPVLVGPSVGYQWGGTSSAVNRWLWSLSFAPK